MADTILAWHFVGKTLRDGRPIPRVGKWLEHNKPLVICQSGLHASRHPFDALGYAPGPILCRVECGGEIIQKRDKLVCQRRRIIKRLDATVGLRYFARLQALSVAQFWEPPDVVLEYLMTGAAQSVARSVAWSAAWSAIESVADSAAWSAIESSAESSAWSAARSAIQSVARSAARSAAELAARTDFAALVYEAFGIKGE